MWPFAKRREPLSCGFFYLVALTPKFAWAYFRSVRPIAARREAFWMTVRTVRLLFRSRL